jgi:hypothetical protein
MFNGDEHKPISIIITTLAAKAYRKQTNVFEGLVHVVNNMESYIEERYDKQLGHRVKWIENPVNAQENFADKTRSAHQKHRAIAERLHGGDFTGSLKRLPWSGLVLSQDRVPSPGRK